MQTQRQEKEEEGKGREGKRPGERRVQEKHVSRVSVLIWSSCLWYTGEHDIIRILIFVLEGSFLIFNLNSSNTIFGFTEPGQGKNKTEC